MKKSQKILLILAVAVAAGAGGWFAANRAHKPATAGIAANSRKVAFYQSAMHPWIKSDKPGKCTICGMDLVPVYEGDKGLDTAAGLVSLGSNTITVMNVQSAPVRRAPLQRTLRVAGTIDDDDSRHRVLSAYVEGRVDQLFVNFVGAEVTAGQALATFYSPMLLAAEREYAALKRQGGPGQESLLPSAAQRLRQFGLNDQQIAALPDKPATNIHTELLAPMSGTVVTRNVYAGQYVKEGEKLFEVADFSTMWFVFDAYERDLAWLRVGQKIDVTAATLPGRVFNAAISFIDPNLNPTTRTARVRAELPNPLIERDGQRRRELLHRIYAEAVVRVETPESLTVPRSAVISPGGEALVYVDKGGGAYEQRAVKLGRVGDFLWEVTDGLTDGERVVVNGNLLIDGQAQLNRSASPTGHQHEVTSSPPVKPPAIAESMSALDAPQRLAAQEFLAVVNSLGAALAADQLDEFNRLSLRLHTVSPALTKSFTGLWGWSTLSGNMDSVAHLAKAPDLTAARKSFSALSLAAVEFAKHLRAHERDFSTLKIFMCPMTEDAFPGAPKKGTWLQLAAPLRNPYFGAEMLECGQEVK